MDLLLPLLIALLASAALAARPPATPASVAISLAAGVIGGATPLPRTPAPAAARSHAGPAGAHGGRLAWPAVTGLGVAAFAAARTLQHPLVPPLGPWYVGATAIVGIAEELLFRRLLYGALATLGTAAAIGGSAAVFAAVHVPAYGVTALPVDFAAGLLFGWQRWASGTWTASGATHAIANVLQSV